MNTIKLTCLQCKTKFDRLLSQHKTLMKRSKTGNTFCTKKCQYKYMEKRETYLCANCNTAVIRRPGDRKCWGENVFCSKHCSAIFNNKAGKTGRKKNNRCAVCSDWAYSKDKCCSKCISTGKYLEKGSFVKDRTLKDLKYENAGPNQYALVRYHSRKILEAEPKICEKCGYSKHVEVCHIREIASYPDDATVAEINKRDNLLILCRNCHWELDHGLFNPK